MENKRKNRKVKALKNRLLSLFFGGSYWIRTSDFYPVKVSITKEDLPEPERPVTTES
jgi:hypothetical protein